MNNPMPKAVQIVKKQRADPKLAGPGSTAHERFLYAELERLQRAVLESAEDQRKE